MFEGIEGVVTSSKPHCRRTAFATSFGGAFRWSLDYRASFIGQFAGSACRSS